MPVQYRLLLATAASVLVLSACNSQNSASSTTPPAASSASAPAASPASKTTVAATVNGAAITEERLDSILKRFTSQNPGQADNPELRKMVLDQMIMQKLTAEEAIKKSYDKKSEVAEQLELTRQSVLSNAYLQDFVTHAQVSDADITAEYEKIKSQLASDEFKARHILVEKEELAKDIIAKIKKNPKAFDGLAKQHSKDPGSKERGGDLGWFDPRAMVPEFGEAVATLEKGKMTEQPVHTKFGYHVIILDDKRHKKAPALDQIKPMLKQQLQQQAMKKMLDDLKAKAKIEITTQATPAHSPITATPATTSAATPAETAKPAAEKK